MVFNLALDMMDDGLLKYDHRLLGKMLINRSTRQNTLTKKCYNCLLLYEDDI